jgi:O-antigen/teichoic acid export membrane protein
VSTTLLSQIALTLGRHVTAALLQLVLIIVVARHLGPEANGHYALGLMVCMTMSGLANLGLSTANAYFVGRDGAGSAATAMRASFSIAAVLTIAGWFAAGLLFAAFGERWFPGIPARVLWAGALAFPVVLLSSFTLSVLQGLRDFRAYNLALIAPPVVSLAAASAAILILDAGATGVLVAWVTGQAAGLMVSTVAVQRRRLPVSHGTVAYVRDALRYGWKAQLAIFSNYLMYRSDVFLVNLFLGPAATGPYFVAVQLVERLWMISQATTTVLLPHLASMQDLEVDRRRITSLAVRLMAVFSAGIALVLAPIAGYLLILLFGDAFASAAGVPVWLLPGVVAYNVARVLASDIAARGRPGLTMKISFAALAINVIFNLLLIPRYGMVGAALATSTAYIAATLLYVLVYLQLAEGETWRTLAPRRADLQMIGAFSRAVRRRRRPATVD